MTGRGRPGSGSKPVSLVASALDAAMKLPVPRSSLEDACRTTPDSLCPADAVSPFATIHSPPGDRLAGGLPALGPVGYLQRVKKIDIHPVGGACDASGRQNNLTLFHGVIFSPLLFWDGI